MSVSASMQSLLVRQLLALNEPEWARRHTGDWLVWEPGAWKVPGVQGSRARTQQLPPMAPSRPQVGDCLCFELNSGSPVTLRIGRAPENDIVLNDATVSREHLVLEKPASQWLVHALPESKATLVNSQPIAAGTLVQLASGDQLSIGGVTLTYLTPVGLLSRLKLEAAKLML